MVQHGSDRSEEVNLNSTETESYANDGTSTFHYIHSYMHAPFITYIHTYIIHDGSVVDPSWERSTAEISGKSRDECKHEEEEGILSCMLTRLI